MLRTGILAMAIFAAMVAATVSVAQAAFDAATYRTLNDALVEDHIVPRYAKLAEATARLNTLAERICDMPSSMSISDLRKAAIAAQDAWQQVQHIRFGPVEQDMRSTRIAFWPDVRKRIDRDLGEILHARNRESFMPERFPQESVVIQGFPALERLLFGKDAGRLLVDGTVDAHFRCAMVHAIAANLAAMSKAIYSGWTQGDDSYANAVSNAGAEFGIYPKAEEATLDMFKSLHAAVEMVADHKLGRPMGDSVEHAQPTRAESWRSRRSLENIRRNLEAAQAMYLGENGSGSKGFSRVVREVAKDRKLDDLLRRAFAQTLATANSIDMPLSQAVKEPAERAKLVKLKTEATALKTILAKQLTAALGIPLGFNALDGD